MTHTECLANILAIHQPEPYWWGPKGSRVKYECCFCCGENWPCQTVRIIGDATPTVTFA